MTQALDRVATDTAFRVVTWNLEWATPRSVKGCELARRIDTEAPDLVCLTETSDDFLAGSGHTITSAPDYGYPLLKGRRKVVLWSRAPWTAVDQIGSPELPPGRFVRGTTHTNAGEVDIIAVCIPWSHAHVNTGHRNRTAWEEHIRYLHGLVPLMVPDRTRPLVVVGDFNQRIPRQRAPERVYRNLETTFDGLTFATVGPIGPGHRLSVDHLAHSEGVHCLQIGALDEHHDAKKLSDHFGLSMVLDRTVERSNQCSHQTA